jgi:thiamine biosynthesis lipoprotein ApbE
VRPGPDKWFGVDLGRVPGFCEWEVEMRKLPSGGKPWKDIFDRLGEILKKNGVHNYWVSLGGDVITSGVDKNNAQISLNIQDASRPNDVSEWVINCPTSHFSTATSGTFRRQNQNHNDNWHHIIDPKTLKPAITDIKLATVCDKSALRADVFASCAVILGSLEAPLFLEKMGVEAALLQCQGKNGKPYEVRYGNEEVITESTNSRKAQIQNA